MVGIDIIRGKGGGGSWLQLLWLKLFTNEFSLNTPDTIKYQLNTVTVYWLWWGMIVSGRRLWLWFSLITSPPLILLSQTHLHSLLVMVGIDFISGGVGGGMGYEYDCLQMNSFLV